MRFSALRSGVVGVACAMVVGMAASPAWGQCAPVPSGLVSWWTGDVDASDSQGTNDGVLTNGAIAGAPGFVGGAFQLDGINDRIITTDANVNLANLTVAAWINPDNVSSGRQRIVTKYNGTGTTAGIWSFDFFADGGLRFNFGDSTGSPALNPSITSPAGTVTSGTWQFVAATYNGITIRIYHNAALVLSMVVNNKGPIPALSQVIVIGEDDPVGTVLEFFDGLIDEVTLFDRALDQTEIQAIYDAGSAGMSPLCCPADVNGDGFVNVLDLVDLLLCFGQPAVPGCVGEDVNGDGTVNVLDLIDVLLQFGQACP